MIKNTLELVKVLTDRDTKNSSQKKVSNLILNENFVELKRNA